MSVLTEPEYFKGNIEFVKDIKSKFSIPVLRKDFTVDEYQIYEAKLYGADAILLIMAALTDAEYKKFHALADSIGLDVLVETHNEEEVKRAVEYGRIIGVNNRNLQTFDEDITTCERLLPLIPDGKVKVAESAIRKHSDFEYLRGLKFDAALIGEAFMRKKENIKKADNLRYEIKICGIRRKEDIDIINKYKPDYIGFIFAKSKREVTPETVAEITKNLDKNIKKVGVFVNATYEKINEAVNVANLDVVQLHGDENQEYISNLDCKCEIWKAVRVRDGEDIYDVKGVDRLLLDKYTDDKVRWQQSNF